MDALKQKIIDEFEKFLKRLQLGYVDDYKKILHEISFILTFSYFDKVDLVYQFLMNN